MDALDEKIKNMDQIVEKIKDSVSGVDCLDDYYEKPPSDEDLIYFG